MKIIVDIAGGLGNQMFSYAFGYALCRKKNAKLIIDTTMQDCGIAREYGLSNFNIVYDGRISWGYKKDFLNRALINKLKFKYAIGITTKLYVEKTPTEFESDVYDVNKDTYFKGNFQSELYFSDCRSELLHLFTLVDERELSVQGLTNKMYSEESVSVHIRRGDYTQIGCVVDMEYYDRAINFIEQSCQQPIFYIFSDDIMFCREYFSKYSDKKIIYPDYHSDNRSIDDMYLMSKCKHNIIANSSYSWWGAWLNLNPKKIVVCPEVGVWKGDFYPSEWIKIKL